MRMRLIAMTLVLVAGCHEPPPKPQTMNGERMQAKDGPTIFVQDFERSGHKFLVASIGGTQGGVSMIHDPSCSCMKP